MTADELHEVRELWPAANALTQLLTDHRRVRDVEPGDLHERMCAHGADRCAAYLFGLPGGYGASLEEAEVLVEELLVLTRVGKKPRAPAELIDIPEVGLDGTEA